MVMIRQQKHFLELIETRVLIGGLVHGCCMSTSLQSASLQTAKGTTLPALALNIGIGHKS